MTDPIGKQELNEIDLNGNLVQKTDRNGSMTTMTYDGLGRLLAKNVSNLANPQMNASYTYTYSSTGNRTVVRGGGAYAANTYDDLGRLLKENDGNAIEKHYTYDVANNRKLFKIIQNGQVKTNTTYDYDNLNRQLHVYENGGTTPTATYSYDENGNRSILAYNNGDTTEYQYNLANKLTQLVNKKGANVLSQYTYTYYLNGNQANKTDSTGKTNAYVYDGLSRLSAETETVSGNATSTTYAYDDANNRKIMTITGANPVAYTYDSNNRLITETSITGNVTKKITYGYDYNGNQIYNATETTQPATGQQESFAVSVSGQSASSSGVTINKYDGFNQLIGTTVGDITVTNTYDGDGLRRSKTVNGATTNHVWDGDQIALETNGSGAVTSRFIRGVNLIATDDGMTARKYFGYNGHGDVVQLADTSGNVTKNYDYDAFGVEKNPDAADTNVFRYSGEYFDKETGTVYLRARYYSPRIGRFISEDSVWGKDNDPLSLNLYTYCQDNPITYLDPSGNSVKGFLVGLVNAADDSFSGGYIQKGLNATLSLFGGDTRTLNDMYANDADYQDAYKAGSIANGVIGVVNIGNGLKQIISKAGSFVVDSGGAVVGVVSGELSDALSLVSNGGAIIRGTDETGKTGNRPPNLSPEGAGRNGAFREAKRNSDIPVSKNPEDVTPAVDKRGDSIPGRDYDFGDGKIIREHSEGHEFPDDPSQNRGPHFNDINGNHYDY